MRREGFAHRRATTKKKKNLSASDAVAAITGFFLDTRVFQLTVPDLTEKRVYNRDQVSMALASSYSKTIDEIKNDVI